MDSGENEKLQLRRIYTVGIVQYWGRRPTQDNPQTSPFCSPMAWDLWITPMGLAKGAYDWFSSILQLLVFWTNRSPAHPPSKTAAKTASIAVTGHPYNTNRLIRTYF